MATGTLSFSPLSSNNVVAPKNRVAVGPCSVFFPSACKLRPRPSSSVRSQATGDNKDAAIDVHVGSGDQGTAVEQRPRRLAADVSPFGKCQTGDGKICRPMLDFLANLTGDRMVTENVHLPILVTKT